MPVQEPVDMSAAWLAHAPPPPPSTAVRKPRRSSSYEPLSASNGSMMNDTHTRGGYLPPSSHSPEPPSSCRSSVSDLKQAAAASSSSTPSSPVKRARSKVTSNPVPPAPSAFYNYQHQMQQQQQQQNLYRHQQQPSSHVAVGHDAAYAPAQAPPTSAAMAQSYSDSNSVPAYAGYARERRDSAPAISYQAPHHAQPTFYPSQLPPANGILPMHSTAYASTVAAPHVAVPPHSAAHPPMSYASPPNGVPASHLQYVQYAAPPQQQQQQSWAPMPQSQPLYQQPVSNPHYPPVAPPPVHQAWEHSAAAMTPPQQPNVAFPVQPGAPSSAVPPNAHVFPAMQQVSSPPMPATSPHPAYASDLSRQSTTSSVGSVRRPLPQPTRTSSNPSAPGSPVTGAVGLTNRASVRRDLPRPPSGSPATISAASGYVSSNLSKADPSSPGSPVAGTTSRLPTTALNRTESVRLAAEALMARGVPQRRPLRSALASTTFSPPLPPTRMAGSPSVSTRELPASQSEPVAPTNGTPPVAVAPPLNETTTNATHRSSQSAGSVLSQSPVRESYHEHATPSAPARFQDALQQSPQAYQTPTHVSQTPSSDRHEPARYQETAQLVDSMASMSMDQEAGPSQAAAAGAAAAPSIPVFSFDAPDEEPEKPRRRRGSSVSRAGPAPGQKVIQQTTASPVTVPTIVLPGDGDDDDHASAAGPSISISGADDDHASAGVSMISVTADDDDARSQTSTGSRGPSISVSFSAEPSAKSQRAGTSHSPSAGPGPGNGAAAANGRVSASSVGSGAGCQGCQKWIAGKVVHALGTTYHPGCFVCAHCSEGLEHVAFYEHEGLPYCHFDYHELFSKRCFHCRTPIVDERYITVQDEELTGQDGETNERCYHELHFFCANCGDPFLDPKAAGSAAGSDPGLMTADEHGKVKHGGMEFIVHKGYPYCEKCHVNLHKPRCKACKKPIVYDLISALGGKWHPECFVCCACCRPFTDTQFFVKDGKPYDEECYKVLLRNMV
ncbi:related to Paxillin [Sporisorium reilianum f. sp. reilianum]|uniref:Related to Paxillin n=1 Tax=Sporisorium reilianum f. sp. reilianum TaxID=72559 RepID=A0A2N8UPL7_9BASI|nr:related to Paxillin [Sporisorium reilianum f. sp. reilianum]